MARGGPRPGSGKKQKYNYFVKGKKFNTLNAAARAFNVSTVTIHNWCGSGPKSVNNCYKEVKKPDKKRSKQKIPDDIKQEAADAEMTPLDYMLKIMRDENVDEKRRDTMAYWAAPYIHSKADKKQGKKPEQAERATRAGSGKFSPSKTPHLKVAK